MKLTDEELDYLLEKETTVLDLLETASFLVVLANNKGFLVRCNNRVKQVLGYSEEEFASRPFLDYVHPDDKKRTEEAYYKSDIFKDEDEAIVEGFKNRYQTKCGKYANLEWYSSGQTINSLNLSIAIFKGYE